MTRRLVTGLALAAFFASPPARADDRAIAQQLFDEGRALLDEGRVAEACPKFAESQRLDPGGGTLLNLALCHEREGKTGTAWTEFHDALAQAVKDDRKDREAFAKSHIDALRPKLVRVVVAVPPAVRASTPEILLDDSKLPQAAWGSAIPVDPGDHRIATRADATLPWSTMITTTEPGRTYTVEIPPGERRPAPPPFCPPGATYVSGICVGNEIAEKPPSETRRSTAFWVTLGGSGALAAASLVTGIVAYDADRYVKDNCSAERDFCRVPDADSAASRASTYAWVSTVTLGLAVTGAVVAFLLPKVEVDRSAARLEVGPGFLRITGM